MIREPFSAKPYMSRGRQVWRVRIPARFSVSGKEQHLYYESRREAEAEAKLLRRKFVGGELMAANLLTADLVSDVRAAKRVLEAAGSTLSLEEAARLAVEREQQLDRSLTVDALFERYAAEVSASRGWSAKYKSTWRQYSSRFAEVFGGELVANISAQALRDFFGLRYASASYYNSALAVIAPAFSWAVKQQTLDKSPFDFVERRKVAASEGVDVFSPEEAERLVRVSRAHGALLPFAILLFAGVRPEELKKLTWQDIRIQADGQMLLHIRPSVAKTRSVRLVRVREPLRSLMASHLTEAPEGSLVPRGWERLSKAVRAEAKLQNRSDAARHSFASYSLAAGESIEAVRADMGHSRGSDMLFKHYRAAVTPESAAQFWSIQL